MREQRPIEPAVADDVTFSQLDRDVRGRLRTLTKANAERVGGHLVMVGRLLDLDPEAAYEHAQAAVRRAGRVDVVREAAGLAAYRTGRYAEALRELRTVRRLNGSSEHLPVMADAERGLGRPERAIALAQEPEVQELSREARIELAIVVSGARLDLGQPEAAVAALVGDAVAGASGLVAARVAQARAAALEAAGRGEEAAAELAAFPQDVLDEAAGGGADDDVVVYDLADEPADDSTQPGDASDGASPQDATPDVDATSEVPSAGGRSADDEAPDRETADGGPADDAIGAAGDGPAGDGAAEHGGADDTTTTDEGAR